MTKIRSTTTTFTCYLIMMAIISFQAMAQENTAKETSQEKMIIHALITKDGKIKYFHVPNIQFDKDGILMPRASIASDCWNDLLKCGKELIEVDLETELKDLTDKILAQANKLPCKSPLLPKTIQFTASVGILSVTGEWDTKELCSNKLKKPPSLTH